jgi:3-oxoacyl-[acyl-carrier-protein] synthase-3
MADARRSGRLRPGMKVLLTSFGSGMTWGSALLV